MRGAKCLKPLYIVHLIRSNDNKITQILKNIFDNKGEFSIDSLCELFEKDQNGSLEELKHRLFLLIQSEELFESRIRIIKFIVRLSLHKKKFMECLIDFIKEINALVHPIYRFSIISGLLLIQAREDSECIDDVESIFKVLMDRSKDVDQRVRCETYKSLAHLDYEDFGQGITPKSILISVIGLNKYDEDQECRLQALSSLKMDKDVFSSVMKLVFLDPDPVIRSMSLQKLLSYHKCAEMLLQMKLKTRLEFLKSLIIRPDSQGLG